MAITSLVDWVDRETGTSLDVRELSRLPREEADRAIAEIRARANLSLEEPVR